VEVVMLLLRAYVRAETSSSNPASFLPVLPPTRLLSRVPAELGFAPAVDYSALMVGARGAAAAVGQADGVAGNGP
jgi:hypothetical protein